jgi:hypothetical protein
MEFLLERPAGADSASGVLLDEPLADFGRCGERSTGSRR